MQIHSDHINAILCIVGSVICAFDWGHFIIMFLLFMQNLVDLKFTGLKVLICNQIYIQSVYLAGVWNKLQAYRSNGRTMFRCIAWHIDTLLWYKY